MKTFKFTAGMYVDVKATCLYFIVLVVLDIYLRVDKYYIFR